MNKTLSGSIQSHRYLFELIKYLTHFTLNLRKKYPDITVKDILVKWFKSEVSTPLTDYFQELNDLIMPIVLMDVWTQDILNEDEKNLTPEEVKDKIIKIITDQTLPF